MIKLMWMAVIMLPTGQPVIKVQENTTFKTVVECKEFGKEMSPRLGDWVRGLAKLEWNVDVKVRFKCSGIKI